MLEYESTNKHSQTAMIHRDTQTAATELPSTDGGTGWKPGETATGSKDTRGMTV